MNRLFIIICLFIFSCQVFSQNIGISNLYTFQPYSINPAYIHPMRYVSTYFIGRNQWMSLDGSPVNTYFGINYPAFEKIALGFKIVGDKQGIFKTLSPEFTYSYTQKISDDQYINFGLAAGIISHRIDKSDLITGTINDRVLDDEYYNFIEFTAGAGIYYSYNKLKVQMVLPRLMEYEHFNQSFFGNIAYDIYARNGNPEDIIVFQPSVTFYSYPTSPYQFDINLLTRIKEQIFIQVSYITNKSLVGSFGINYKNIILGYSYEYNMGDLSHLSKGGHEIMASYAFEAKGHRIWFQNRNY